MDTTHFLLGCAAVVLGAFVAAKGLWAGRPERGGATGDSVRCFASAVLALLIGAATYGVQSLGSGHDSNALCLPAQSLGSPDAPGLVLSLASLIMAGRVFARRRSSTPSALVAAAAATYFYPVIGATAAAGIAAACFLRPLDDGPRRDLFRLALGLIAVVVAAVLIRTGERWGDPGLMRGAPGAIALALLPGAVVASLAFSSHLPRARDAKRRGGEGDAGLAGPVRSAPVRRRMSLYALTAVSAAGAAGLFDANAASLAAICLGVLAGGALVDLGEKGGGRRLFAALAALFFVVFGLLGIVQLVG